MASTQIDALNHETQWRIAVQGTEMQVDIFLFALSVKKNYTAKYQISEAITEDQH